MVFLRPNGGTRGYTGAVRFSKPSGSSCTVWWSKLLGGAGDEPAAKLTQDGEVLPGRPLASVSVEGKFTAGLEREIRKAFVLGPERTPEQDVEFGMIQISDIAIKALSPSINDPTTAVRCIDRLSQLLAELGTRQPPEPKRTRDGRVCFVAHYTTFEDAIKVSYDAIRHFGAGIPLVAEQLLHTLAELLVLAEGERREPLIEQARAVLRDARREIQNPRDLAAVEKVAKRFSERAGYGIGEAGDSLADQDSGSAREVDPPRGSRRACRGEPRQS